MIFSIFKALSLVALASTAFASPLAARHRRDVSIVSSSNNVSFNNWGGLSSLSNFDDFFGVGNLFGQNNQQVIVVEQAPVCQAGQVLLIQQQLAIVQEFAKQIITQQLCDVEAQVLVLEQFRGGLGDFRNDLGRQSGRNVGFDQNIALLILQLLNQDGSLNLRDFGFQGINIGQKFVVPSGNNWRDESSPQAIQDILQLLESARA